MINSIKFTGQFGYIIEKPEKPEPPRNRSRCYYNMTQEESELHYKEAMKHYRKHKNDYINSQLAKNLLDRTFNFSQSKINVIFGPNASGKTTMIKALTGNALIRDGFTTLYAPFDIRMSLNNETTEQDIIKFRDRLMKNSAEIDWTGTPIYYENFASRTGHQCGDLTGSIIRNIGEEIYYKINKSRQSMGENSMFILSRVMEIASNPVTYDRIFEEELNRFKQNGPINDVWTNCFRAQMDYILSHPEANSGKPVTVIFDEIDKSMDILNVIHLYRDIFPMIVEKTGIQLILVSHSPVIITGRIFNSDKYNIISLDPEYTEECRQEIASLIL